MTGAVSSLYSAARSKPETDLVGRLSLFWVNRTLFSTSSIAKLGAGLACNRLPHSCNTVLTECHISPNFSLL